jgi:plasmid stabilization system protein ParE
VKLRYTLPALDDLKAILDYIDRQSPQGAARVKNRIQAIVDLLLLHPLVGTRTDDPATRRMATPPYILFSTKRRATSLLFTPSATLRVTHRPCRSDE